VLLLSQRQEATEAAREGGGSEALDSQKDDSSYAEQMLHRIRNFFQLHH
jgi:hypothetical protein